MKNSLTLSNIQSAFTVPWLSNKKWLMALKFLTVCLNPDSEKVHTLAPVNVSLKSVFL